MKFEYKQVNGETKQINTDLTQAELIKFTQDYNKKAGLVDQVKELNFLNGQYYNFFNYGNGYLE